MSAWTDLYPLARQLHGDYCWSCEIAKWDQLHHILVHRAKGHPEFDTIENACPICEECHPYRNGWKWRVKFWKDQCRIFGREHMLEWLHGLGMKSPPRFDLIETA